MNEDFVTYELAVKLKENGFREECLCHYIGEDLVYNIESPIANNQLWFSHNKFDNIWHRDNVDAPTIPQVLRWLRKEKKIYIVIAVNPTFSTKDKIAYYYQVYSNSNGVTSDYYESEECYAQWKDCAIGSIKSVLKYLI